MSDDIVARLRQLGKQFHATDEDLDNAGCDLEWQSVQMAGETIVDAIAEIERLRRGGCARDQTSTQFCAEAAALQAEVERLRELAPEVRRLADRIEEFHRLAIELREADCGLVDMRVTTAQAFRRLHDAERAFDAAIGFKRPRLDAEPDTGDVEEVQDAGSIRIRKTRKPKRGGSSALRETGSAEADGPAGDPMDDAG